MKYVVLSLTYASFLFTGTVSAHGGVNHSAPVPVTPGRETPASSTPAAADGDAYSLLAGHLVFAAKKVHAHAYWKQAPAVDEEGLLQLEFRDAETHEITEAGGFPGVTVWNEAYGYGLVQPSVEPSLDKDGKVIVGAFSVSNIYFLATGQWEVRVYLPQADGKEVFETIKVDLGDLAPNPADDPNSPIHIMMPGGMGGMNHGPHAKPQNRGSTNTPNDSSQDHNHSNHPH